MMTVAMEKIIALNRRADILPRFHLPATVAQAAKKADENEKIYPILGAASGFEGFSISAKFITYLYAK
jgi:hypothetical protein